MREISYLLVDLDGTLIDVDEGSFVAEYFGKLVDFFKDDFDGIDLVKTVMRTVEEISKNPDGVTSNYDRFMREFSKRVGVDARSIGEKFEDFYRRIFPSLRVLVKPRKKVVEKLRVYRKFGVGLVLATNPIFPRVAVLERLSWSGMERDEFVLITYMENSKYCKPDCRYFLEICEKVGTTPDQCVMVGNDELYDGACKKIGMEYIDVDDFLGEGE